MVCCCHETGLKPVLFQNWGNYTKFCKNRLFPNMYINKIKKQNGRKENWKKITKLGKILKAKLLQCSMRLNEYQFIWWIQEIGKGCPLMTSRYKGGRVYKTCTKIIKFVGFNTGTRDIFKILKALYNYNSYQVQSRRSSNYLGI